MALFLFRFWPALLPLLLYVLWYLFKARRAVKSGQPKPLFSDGPIYWTILASLFIAVLCFIWLGAHIEPNKGEYTPPLMKNGAIQPGHVE